MEETIEFLSIKDPHFRFGFNPPSNRTNNFFEEIDNKIDQLISYGKKHNITNLIITGDINDEYNSLKWKFTKNYLENKKRIEKLSQQFKIYSNAGNHDFLDGKETITNSPFEEYYKQNLIKYFNNKKIIIQNKTKDKQIYFYGLDYSKEKSKTIEQLKKIETELKNKKPLFSIVLLHIGVVPYNKEKDIENIFTDLNYQKLNELIPSVSLIINGHYHKGFQTQKLNNQTFINNWAFTRLSMDKYSISKEHVPEFEHITFNLTTKQLTTKTIQLNVVPFEKAFIQKTEIESELNKHKIDVSFDNIKKINDTDKKNEKQIFNEIKNEIEEKLFKEIQHTNKEKIIKDAFLELEKRL